jgi:aryl-alcohol dehydrogenase-like predicted oxidoreductase
VKMRVLGRTGVVVSELCLGAMMFGEMGNPDHDSCLAIIDRAIESGINFIDTADAYSRGESETIVGKALKGRRDSMVVATKFFHPMASDPNARGGSRRWITRACEDSLRRLDTDYIDIYQMHRPDPATDIEETMSALDDLVRAGKVRILGASSYPPELIVDAQWAAARRNTERLRCEQPQYSIFNRAVESGVLPLCERYGMGVIPWSPLNSGWLTGKYRRGGNLPADSRLARMADRPSYDLESDANQRKFALVEDLVRLASDTGVTLVHLALGFVLEHPAVTAAIIGPRTLPQLEDQLGAPDVTLDEVVLNRIDELVPPGTDIDPRYAAFEPPAISDPMRRRRSCR